MSDTESDAVDTGVEDLPAENVQDDDISMFLAPDDDEKEQEEAQEEPEQETAEDDGEEPAEEAEEAEEPLYAIWSEDGPQMVTEAEAKSAVMRQQDYTKKTMEAAETRKEAEAALEARNAKREELMESLAQWAVPMDQQPDWAHLAQTLQPQQFNLARVQWEEKQQQSATAQQAYRTLQAEIQAEKDAEKEQERSNALERLYETFPEWRDPTVAKQAAQEITESAKHYGFSDEEVSEFVDDRVVRLLRDAKRLREIEANTAQMEKRVFKPGETLRPGSKTTAKQKSERTAKQKLDRLRKTDSDDSFADWLITG